MSTFFTELFRVAKLLNSSDNYKPVFLFHSYPSVKKEMDACYKEKIECFDLNGQCIHLFSDYFGGIPPATSYIEQLTIKKSVLKFLRGIVPGGFRRGCHSLILKTFRKLKLNFVSNSFTLVQDLKKIKENYTVLFNKIKPNLLILAGDEVGNDSALLIRAGHEYGIDTIITPSTMSNGLEQAEVYYNNPSHSMGNKVNWVAGKLFPRWVLNHKGRKLLRVNGERVFAFEWLKIGPPLPWIFHSGFSDAIAVESPAMLNYYLDAGLPEKQLVLTGSPVNDIMGSVLQNKEQLRSDLYKELNMPKDRPMILSALPPDFLYVVGGRPQCDFQEYDELVKFWLTSLAEIKEYNIVIALHPSVDYYKVKHLENYGIKIARENIVYLMPLCDIFIASVSSTIRWAIVCGIPVINYDVYRYQYSDYLNVDGVITLEEKEDFLRLLHKLTGNPDFYAEIAKKQRNHSKAWGIQDGLSGKRVLDLVDRFIKKTDVN